MRILFAVCSWGLGHATRDLPLIRGILEAGHNLTLIGKGRSLSLLKSELKDSCHYISIPDYSSVYSEREFSVARFLGYFPVYIDEIVREHSRVRKLIKKEKFERIISDNRFGIYDKEIPSYFISHQLRFIAPGRIKLFEMATEGFNYSFFKEKFYIFLIPDNKEDSLSGDLSHNLRYFKESKVKYLGVFSDLKKMDIEQDIDCFISLSGPEPQRTVLEKIILKQALSLKGKVVIALGRPEDPRERFHKHLHIFGCLERKKQQEIMNRAKLVVTRSGYTTLMELAALSRKALLIPTPGQTEQVYLAEYHKKKKNFYSVNQDELDLVRDVEEAKQCKGLSCEVKTDKAVEAFMETVFGE